MEGKALPRNSRVQLQIKLGNQSLTVEVLPDETLAIVIVHLQKQYRQFDLTEDFAAYVYLPLCRLLRPSGSKLLEQMMYFHHDAASYDDRDVIWLVRQTEFNHFRTYLDNNHELPIFHGRRAPIHISLLNREQLVEFVALNTNRGQPRVPKDTPIRGTATNALPTRSREAAPVHTCDMGTATVFDASSPNLSIIASRVISPAKGGLAGWVQLAPNSSSSSNSGISMTRRGRPIATPGTNKLQACRRFLVGYDRPEVDILAEIAEKRRAVAEKVMDRRRAIKEEHEARRRKEEAEEEARLYHERMLAEAAAREEAALEAARQAQEQLAREARRFQQRIEELEADKQALESARGEEEERLVAAETAAAAAAAVAEAEAVAVAIVAAEAATAAIVAAPSPPPPPPPGPPPSNLETESARIRPSPSPPPKPPRRASVKFVAPKRRSVIKETVRRVVTLLSLRGRRGDGDDKWEDSEEGSQSGQAVAAEETKRKAAPGTGAPASPFSIPPPKPLRCGSVKFIAPKRRSTLKRVVSQTADQGSEEEEEDDTMEEWGRTVELFTSGSPALSRIPFSSPHQQKTADAGHQTASLDNALPLLGRVFLPHAHAVPMAPVFVTYVVPETLPPRAAPAPSHSMLLNPNLEPNSNTFDKPLRGRSASHSPTQTRSGSMSLSNGGKPFVSGLDIGMIPTPVTAESTKPALPINITEPTTPSSTSPSPLTPSFLRWRRDEPASKTSASPYFSGSPTHVSPPPPHTRDSPTPSPLRSREELVAMPSPSRARTPSVTLEARLDETRSMLLMLDLSAASAAPDESSTKQEAENLSSQMKEAVSDKPSVTLTNHSTTPTDLSHRPECVSRSSPLSLTLDQMEREAQDMQIILRNRASSPGNLLGTSGVPQIIGPSARAVSPLAASAAHLMLHNAQNSPQNAPGSSSSSGSSSSPNYVSPRNSTRASTAASMSVGTDPMYPVEEIIHINQIDLTTPVGPASEASFPPVISLDLLSQVDQATTESATHLSPQTPERPGHIVSLDFLTPHLRDPDSNSSTLSLAISATAPAKLMSAILPYPGLCVQGTLDKPNPRQSLQCNRLSMADMAPSRRDSATSSGQDLNQLLPLELYYLPFIRIEKSFCSSFGVLRLAVPPHGSFCAQILEAVSDCTAWIATLWVVFQLYGNQEGPLCKSITSQQVKRALKEAGFKEDVCNRVLLTSVLVMTKHQAAHSKTRKGASSGPLSKTGTVKAGLKKTNVSDKHMTFKEFLLVMSAFVDSMKKEHSRNGISGWADAEASVAGNEGRFWSNSVHSMLSWLSEDYTPFVCMASPFGQSSSLLAYGNIDAGLAIENSSQPASFRNILMHRLRTQYGTAPIKNCASHACDSVLDRAALCLSGVLSYSAKDKVAEESTGPGTISVSIYLSSTLGGGTGQHYSPASLESVRLLWERNATLFQQLYSFYAETLEARVPLGPPAPGVSDGSLRPEDSYSFPGHLPTNVPLHPIFVRLHLWNTNLSSQSGQSVLMLSFDQLLIFLKDFAIFPALIDIQKLNRCFKSVKLWEWTLADSVAAAPPAERLQAHGESLPSSPMGLFRPPRKERDTPWSPVEEAFLRPTLDERSRQATERGPVLSLETQDPLGMAATSRALTITLR